MSAAIVNKKLVLSLYKQMIKEAGKFDAYNFRKYAIRRIRDGFRDNRVLSNETQIQSALEEASRNLETIKRQVIFGNP
jgi:hypothetical protein